MLPKIITLVTSKGGAGKTTLARSLACHWFNLGQNTGIVDADPQGSIKNLHDAEGVIQKIPVIFAPEEDVREKIVELSAKCHPVVVDTGGFRNRTTVLSLVASEVAIIPLKPSPDDMVAAIQTYNLIKELNETPERVQNPIKCKLILTMTQQGTIIAKHIRQEMESIGLPLLKNEMYQRVAYPETAIKGLSPCISDPDGPAARDIAKIVAEILEL